MPPVVSSSTSACADVAGVVELAGDAGDVVVADERHRHEGVEEFVVPLQRPVELVEVAVVEAAPDRLPQLVLGHGVERRRRAPCAGVVAVDDLADEPRVGDAVRGPAAAPAPRTVRAPRRRRRGASRRRRGAASATSRRRRSRRPRGCRGSARSDRRGPRRCRNRCRACRNHCASPPSRRRGSARNRCRRG